MYDYQRFKFVFSFFFNFLKMPNLNKSFGFVAKFFSRLFTSFTFHILFFKAEIDLQRCDFLKSLFSLKKFQKISYDFRC